MDFQFKHEPSATHPDKTDPNHPENEHFSLWAWEHKAWLEAKGEVEAAVEWAKEIAAHVSNAIEAKVSAYRKNMTDVVDVEAAKYKAKLESEAKAAEVAVKAAVAPVVAEVEADAKKVSEAVVEKV